MRRREVWKGGLLHQSKETTSEDNSCSRKQLSDSRASDKADQMPLGSGGVPQAGIYCLVFTCSALSVLVLSVCIVPLTAEAGNDVLQDRSPRLKMDQALLYVHNEVLNKSVTVFWVSDQCFRCLYQPLVTVGPGTEPGHPSTRSAVIDAQHPLTLQVNETDGKYLCSVHYNFGEFGNYSLWLKVKNDSTEKLECSVIMVKQPANTYFPVLIAFLVYMGLAIVICLGFFLLGLNPIRNFIQRVLHPRETERLINSELGSPRDVNNRDGSVFLQNPPPPRLRSLDTFRGLSLIVMVFVNYGGGRYWFFRHQSWNGLTVADLVFPWFVFIMGTSICLSFDIMVQRGHSRWSLLRKVLWRSLVLILLGVFVINPNYCNGVLVWENLRIPGVLQRLGLSYLVVAILELLLIKPRTENTGNNSWSFIQHITIYWPQWTFVLILETVWLCLTFLLPVPGCPSGYLGPGGIGDFGLYPNCTGGAAGYIDHVVLGINHIYKHPTCNVMYQTTVPYDPEGILGTISSVIMAFLGVQAGRIFMFYKDQRSQILIKFLIWSTVLGVVSAILTKGTQNEGYIPINKNLWSISYVTTLSSFAFVILLVVYYLVDVKKWWSGAPFFYPGMNSILVYVGHEVFADYFPFKWKMKDGQLHSEHLLQNLVATSIWVIVSYVLYKKRIFWKI
ncbi:heparan-alpha-glucosaminide N-acetyltransferase [Protopterus annectens]|uniref:heparan-alpha-glucosaminide N-acetyltransferase n=1 Tax=Protopterus annectens TaxID=7888 RepID=UPI001CFB823A|nr:heparan-alpha-glucosaminide N-acetyltransferase [Protopterus annectens]